MATGSSQMFDRIHGLLFFMILMLLISSSPSSQAAARKFIVGGKDGWIVKPSENYDHWAQRNRFQVNDTLYFKYEKGSNSVLVVKKEDYDSCNTNSSIRKMDDGDSTFHLENSGLFFFISGNTNNCKNGQKLVVLVMAIRHSIPHSSPPIVPSSEGPGMPSQQIDPSSPMPSPSNDSSSTRLASFIGVGVSLGVGIGVNLIFTGFIRLV